MKTSIPTPSLPRAKRDAVLREATHDSYRSQRKPRSPAQCPKCQAVFQNGRWKWSPAPAAAQSLMCPACHRIHDDFPAGFVTLKGEFLVKHRDEVLRLARNIEEREKSEHPLQRIMQIADSDEGILITTTDIHLARAIGDALFHAYRGELDFNYSPKENLIRVMWER